MTKRKRKKNANSDLGTDELRAKSGYVQTQTNIAGMNRTINTTADQLQTYFRRKRISRRQYNAGDIIQLGF